jgi:hypothetical protein
MQMGFKYNSTTYCSGSREKIRKAQKAAETTTSQA